MPIVNVTLIEGKSEEQKHVFMEQVTTSVVNVFGSTPQSVTVIINEVPATNLSVAGIPKGKTS